MSMKKFYVDYDDHRLLAMVRALTPTQLRVLRTKYPEAYISDYIHQIREEIAIEAVNQIKAKINLTFTGGWGGRSSGPRRPLMESVYYKFDESGDVYISSYDSVLDILNAGFDSFDMKEKLRGRTVPLRLPGGRIIYRRIEDLPMHRVDNLNPNLRTKKNTMRRYYNTKNWIHPGYQGKHIYEQVAREMKPWVEEFVRERIYALLRTLDNDVYVDQSGYMRYNYREHGRFAEFNVLGRNFEE